MDKFEFKVKYDEIRSLCQEKKYAEAAAIADTIDWSRKKPTYLMQVADIYKKNRRYDDAIELLQIAEDRMQGNKEIYFSLCELYIKTNNVLSAVEYYKEFNKIASNDSRKYILKYLIYAMQDVAIGERITVLEQLKNCDYTERWAYELAFLYYRAGLKTKCVEECDELITWFGEGKYAYKTMELKMLCGQALSSEQQEKYDHRFDVFKDSRWDGPKVGKGDNKSASEPSGAVNIPNGGTEYATDNAAGSESENAAYNQTGNENGYTTGNDNGYASGIENSYTAENEVPAADFSENPAGYENAEQQVPTGYDNLSEDEQKENAALMGQTIAYTPSKDKKAASNGEISSAGIAGTDPGSAEAIALSMGYTQVYHGIQPEPDIQVKQVDVGEYNTINLQRALAEGVAEVLNGGDTTVAATTDIIKADTKKIIGVEADQQAKKDQVKNDQPDNNRNYEPHSIDDATVEIARVSGTFTATKTIPFHDIQKEVREKIGEGEAQKPEVTDRSAFSAENQGEIHAEIPTEIPAETPAEIPVEIPTEENETSRRKITQVIPQNTENNENYGIATENDAKISAAEARAMSAQPPEALAEVLTQEDDGQISLVMPEDHTRLARQITGQLSISDVMAEWNKMKAEREEANRKKFHDQVKQQTGEIFNEFEKEALNGVLETLNIGSGSKVTTYEPTGHLGKIDYSPIEKSGENDGNVNDSSDVEIGDIGAETAEDGTEVASAEVARAEVVGTEVAEAEVIGAGIAGAEIVGAEIAGAEAVGEGLAGTVAVGAGLAGAVAGAAVAEAANAGAELNADLGDLTAIAADQDSDDDQVEELTEIIQPAETAEDIDIGLSDWRASEEEAAVDSSNENIENSDDNAEESDEKPEGAVDTFENSEEDSENSEEGSENSEEDSENSDTETAVKNRRILGLNETTELFIRKKNEKEAKKAAAENPESVEAVKDDTRELTDDEKALFGPYVQSTDSKKQLIGVLDNVSMASYTGNIIITGGDENDTSDLAISIMKYLKQTDSNFSGKVARTSARSLNNKKMEAVVKQLSNGALIVEGASVISDEIAGSMRKCLEQENLGIIIALIDTERNMEKLIERAPELMSMFTARMNIIPLTRDQLSAYAKSYAYEKEYSIDQMGMLALAKQIDAKQTSTHSVNILEVKEIVDKAIEHVNRKTVGHFFDVFGGKRYDSEDMIILGEKDFRN